MTKVVHFILVTKVGHFIHVFLEQMEYLLKLKCLEEDAIN